MPTKSLELKHTLKLIGVLDSEIDEIESEIKKSWMKSTPQSWRFLVLITVWGLWLLLRLEISPALVLPTRFLPMRVYHLQPINLVSWNPLILIWKSAVPNIYVLPWLMLLSMSGHWDDTFRAYLQNFRKESTAMLPLLMPRKNWYDSFMQWNYPVCLT